MPSESGHRSSPTSGTAAAARAPDRCGITGCSCSFALLLLCARAGRRGRPARPGGGRARAVAVGAGPRGHREVGSAVGSTCDGFFLGTDATLQTRPQNGAPAAARGPRPCATHASVALTTQTKGIRGHVGYSLNSLSAGSVRHESCQLIRHFRDHTLSPSLGAGHVARAAGCGGAVNA